MPLIKEFHIKYPKIKIKIFNDKPNDLIKKAKFGLIDIIFMNLPYSLPNDFDKIKLIELHDCLVANNSYLYLKNKNLTKKDLEKLPLLILTKGTIARTRLDDYCVENNININPEMELGSNTLIKEFTEAGFGIGILTKERVKKELDSGNLFELNMDIPLKEKIFGMVYSNNLKSTSAKKFIMYIKNNIS